MGRPDRRAQDLPELELAGFRPDTLVTGERRDGFAPNVNVIREPGLPEGVTAGDYADITRATLRDPASSGFPPEVIEALEDQHLRDLSERGSIELAVRCESASLSSCTRTLLTR